MRAAVNTRYGAPEKVLQVVDVDKPIPKSSELLVKVYYSSVNRTDSGFLRAKPFIVRGFSGLVKPKNHILGNEFSGIVEEVGSDVKKFKTGDRIFGFNDVTHGGHGDYLVVDQKRMIASIPDNTSLKLAGVATEGSHYAQSYIEVMKKLGVKKVFVHGATGGIGSSAVQLLKFQGFDVVATSTTKNMKLVKLLGARKVIDWQKQDFTNINEKFDLVFDAVGKSSFRKCKKILNPGGIYIATELGHFAQNPLLALISPLYKLFSAKRVLFPLPQANKNVIKIIKDALATESFKPIIDRTYKLDEIIKAYAYVETGQKTGNVAIKIAK